MRMDVEASDKVWIGRERGFGDGDGEVLKDEGRKTTAGIKCMLWIEDETTRG